MDEDFKRIGEESAISGVEDLMDNEHIKRLLNSKIVKFFSKDSPSKIALATAIITLRAVFIRTLEYMRIRGYLSVFAIPVELVRYSSSYGLTKFLFQAIIFVGLLSATAVSYLVIDSLWFSHKLRKMTYSVPGTRVKLREKIVGF